jgi:transcription initiation factor TFIIB
MSTTEKIMSCQECGNEDLIRDYEAGELVCERCGFVISSMLFNHGPEWRAFDEEQREKRVRVGAPLTWTIHDKGLSTTIDWHDRDFYGRKLAPEQKAKVYRLRKWHRRSKVSGATERNLAYALSELTKTAYKLNLPRNVLETASVIYRKVVRARLIRGRSIQGVAAASIYMACRQCDIIRTLEEVSDAAHISKKEGGRNYRFLLRKLETKVPPVEPQSYISKFVSQLTLSGETESVAMMILNKAIELRLTSGRGPAGIAAAATYIASTLTNERRTQGEIARGAQVTEVTIRNRYKELTQKLNIEVDI